MSQYQHVWMRQGRGYPWFFAGWWYRGNTYGNRACAQDCDMFRVLIPNVSNQGWCGQDSLTNLQPLVNRPMQQPRWHAMWGSEIWPPGWKDGGFWFTDPVLAQAFVMQPRAWGQRVVAQPL
jgi:hypothetical protein